MVTSERWDGPIPPGHGEGNPDVRDVRDPVPVCPVCGGMMTRTVVTGPSSTSSQGSRSALTCHVHGEKPPKWEYV